jgi:hypothetical protein
LTDAEDLSECTLDDELRERLLLEQIECTFMWTNTAGQPFGVAMSYLWRKDRIWLTAAETRARVPAVRRTGYAAVMISSVGTAIGPGKTVSMRGPCRVHHDAETKAWMLPELARAVRRDNPEGAASFLELLDSPGRVVLELEPEYELSFDSRRMWQRRPDAAPPGRL